MADDENNQPKKSRGILKILGFVFGGLFLVGAGTHPGPGLPGVLASADILDEILPDVKNVANKKVYSTNKKVMQVQ